MLKINGKLSVILAYTGSILSLAALLVFKLLPTSELANGIQYSGTDAIWVLAICPVLAIVGAVCFMASFVKDLKAWKDLLPEELLRSSTIAIAVCLIISVAVYLSYFLKQLKLGFVAPFQGTIYELYSVVVTMMTINQFILSTFAAIAIKRNNK